MLLVAWSFFVISKKQSWLDVFIHTLRGLSCFTCIYSTHEALLKDRETHSSQHLLPINSLKENFLLSEGSSLRNYPVLYYRCSQAVTSVQLSGHVQQCTVKFYTAFHRAGCFHLCWSYLEHKIRISLTLHIQSVTTSPLKPMRVFFKNFSIFKDMPSAHKDSWNII